MSAAISLAGKVALVTGGGRGIGKAIAGRLAEAGAAVVIASRKLENLRATAAEFADEPGMVVPIACHIDRRKKGPKHTLMVDRHGIPLAIRAAGRLIRAPMTRDKTRFRGRTHRPPLSFQEAQ